ncbi:hypothetical protein PYCCODRAFT_672485 [Trametes coccinea BRFM310]|uniref:Uncharacterized protein n=1 Tax=Trametes coccinea (strain BRFM310) TaxID=1353009 RepID=A0A1Y2IHP5_TRAC3|nr:hypothetical protein PYCCODRAFT_672485 [Trametes coccinea BRFM310]
MPWLYRKSQKPTTEEMKRPGPMRHSTSCRGGPLQLIGSPILQQRETDATSTVAIYALSPALTVSGSSQMRLWRHPRRRSLKAADCPFSTSQRQGAVSQHGLVQCETLICTMMVMLMSAVRPGW